MSFAAAASSSLAVCLRLLGVFGGRGRSCRERGEAVEFGEGEATEFKMHVAKMQPHRPRLGDLQYLVKIAEGGREVAESAEQARAGEMAERNIDRVIRAAQFRDGRLKMLAGFVEMRRGVGWRRSRKRHAERGAAEAGVSEILCAGPG